MNRTEKYLIRSFQALETPLDSGRVEQTIRLLHAGPGREKNPPRISWMELAGRLVRFTGWKIWLSQGAVLIVSVLMLCAVYGGTVPLGVHGVVRVLCLFAGLIPLSSLPYLYRSVRCGMQEIEMAAAFSFAGQLLIRMAVIGLGDLLLLAGGVGVSIVRANLPPAHAVLYGMASFLLLTSALLFAIARFSLRGAATLLACAYALFAGAVLVSGPAAPPRWNGGLPLLAGCAVLAAGCCAQLWSLCRKTAYRERQIAER